jgi:hypothetical protein
MAYGLRQSTQQQVQNVDKINTNVLEYPVVSRVYAKILGENLMLFTLGLPLSIALLEIYI